MKTSENYFYLALENGVKKMQDSEMYFCLAADGLLYILGNHGDYEAAEATAESLGLDIIWLFGEDSARSWRDTLNSPEARAW